LTIAVFKCRVPFAVKFRSSQGLPPHQDRRLQLRMLGFVGLIALAMFAWQAWRIYTGRGGSSHPHFLPTDEEADGDVAHQRLAPLKDDEVRIPPPDATQEIAARLDDDDSAEDSISIPSTWLATVKDNSIGIRKSESDAYYRILAKVRSTSVRELQARADPDALYANLMASPDRFRGRPVTIVGELRNLYEYSAPSNNYGVERLYDAWIVTSESGNLPYRVVCQSIPPELKPGENLGKAVKVTGYFFKKEGYEAKSRKVQVAPTILAGRLALYVSPNSPPPVEHVVPWMIGVITVIGLAMLATVIGFALSDSRARRAVRSAPPIDAIETERLSAAVDRRPSIEESLRRLEDGEFDDARHREPSRNGNGELEEAGHSRDEVVDLPTPFPPTRVPKRWDGTQ
jgi:hypothetical protein